MDELEFKRRPVKGANPKTIKHYYSQRRHYRLIWRTEAFGVTVPAACQACVQCDDGWDFVGKQGPYKSVKRAVEAAKKHRKIWLKLLRLADGERKGRIDRIRSYEFQTREWKQRIIHSVPLWVRKEANPKHLELLIRALFPRWKEPKEAEDTPESNTVQELQGAA